MTVRKATPLDVQDIARLSALKRKQYEKYQPVFHKEAENAFSAQSLFLTGFLQKENVVALVEEDAEKGITGFVIGAITNAPPVYDPGGQVCLVDDFMVTDPSQWETLGKALLDKVVELCKEKGAVLAIVVCGPLDKAKRDMLNRGGFSVATEWNVKDIR